VAFPPAFTAYTRLDPDGIAPELEEELLELEEELLELEEELLDEELLFDELLEELDDVPCSCGVPQAARASSVELSMVCLTFMGPLTVCFGGQFSLKSHKRNVPFIVGIFRIGSRSLVINWQHPI
jgi:hypothetical protein